VRFLSLFSGIEAASVAWIPLGWKCVAVAEIERFPNSVLKHHYPDVPNLGDVTKISEQQIKNLGPIDVVIFGFPCQDLSQAGKRQGLNHADGTLTRSGLFYYAERISRWANARWAVAENVPGLFSSNEGRDFAAVVGELVGTEISVPGCGWRSAGVALGPRGLVEWIVLDAQWFGLAQRRKRVFIVRDSSGQWLNRPPLFLNAASLRGDTPPRREAGKGTSPTLEGRSGRSGENNFNTSGGLALTISARSRGGGGLGTDAECGGAVIPIQEIGKRQSGNPMNGVGHGAPGDPMFTLQSGAQHGIAHALRAEGFDASEDGTGRGTPLVTQTLTSNGDAHSGFKDESGLVPEIAWALQERDSKGSDSNTKEGHLIPCEKQDEITTLAVRGRNGDSSLETRNDGTANAILTPNGGRGGIGVGAIQHKAAVRRLTPVECSRLQGFPDEYLKISEYVADGPMYKALGNSFAVNVVRWIGQRIQLIDSILKRK
jgi:DNA (cytosine-5)-methyltransferase 1